MKKRDSFTNRLGFILACVGSAVGMGNLWMFPTRVSLYGGGSFLIPYFIFVVLIVSSGKWHSGVRHAPALSTPSVWLWKAAASASWGRHWG